MPLRESPPTPSSIPESPRRSAAVGQLLRAFALACAAAVTQPVSAADREEMAPVMKLETVVTETPFDRFYRTLDDAVVAFDHDDFNVRGSAFDALIAEIDAGILITNPLPDDIFLSIKKRQTSDLLPEQEERLRQLFKHALLQEQLNPLRIRCPKAEGISLAESLSKRFDLPVMSDDPKIAAALERYQEGGEGQTYAEALKRLCDEFQCVPELRPYGLVLVKDSEGIVRINEYLCQIDRDTPEGTQSEIFLLPNHGAILTAKDDASDPIVWTATNAAAPWRKPIGQNTDMPLTGFDADSVITYLAAVCPETISIQAEEGALTSIGDQAFYIESISKAPDGSWMTTIKGSWSPDQIDWRSIMGHHEMHLYQMTAATGYTVETVNGDRIGCVPCDLAFNRRNFALTLCTPAESGQPSSVKIRAFKQYQTQMAPLP